MHAGSRLVNVKERNVGRMVLKRNTFGGCELDICGSGKAKLAGCCDGGNELSVYVEFVKLFS